jgi:hypothetical protein
MAAGVPALHPEEKGRLDISPKANWVQKRGGLPAYLNAVAVALVRKGMTRQRAIATAVNVMKKTCATGLWGGHAGENVSPAIRAAACASVAQWEKMKAETSMPSDERQAVELAREWEALGSIELAWLMHIGSAVIDLAWDPTKHPRVGKGKAGGGRFAKGSSPQEVHDAISQRRHEAERMLHMTGHLDSAKGNSVSAIRQALRKYQAEHDDLTTDGKLDPKTLKHLRRKTKRGRVKDMARRFARAIDLAFTPTDLST